MGHFKKKKRPAVAVGKPAHSIQPQPTATSYAGYYFFSFLLIVATVLLYAHSLKYPLIFDDLTFFTDTNLERLGSSFFHLDLRWFSYASFGWTYNLFDHDWFWYRVGNLALHAITSILLFVFFSRLLNVTQPQATADQIRWLALFGALIFVLHPVAVYGVAYLVQRSILMATLFGIATLLCYMEGLIQDKAKWFLLSALFYFMAVFSKEHSIMIPGVAASLTVLLHKPSFALVKKIWLPFVLYFVISTLVILRAKGVLGITYEDHAAAMLAQMSEHEDIHIDNAYPLSVITQGYLFFKYLLLWIIPYTGGMSIDIRQPFATSVFSWPQLPGFILFLAYPILAIKLLLQGGRQGLIGLGLLFPWMLYLTEISTVRIQEPFVLYRSYLWMCGLPIILFGFISATPRKFTYILLAVFCLALASLSWSRLDTLSDPIKTWSDAIDKYQGDHLLFIERGYNNRGKIYEISGHFPEALADYQKIIELKTKQPKDNSIKISAFNRLDYAYENRGVLLTKMGRYAESLSDFDYVIQLSPDDPVAYKNRAVVYSNLGRLQDALDDYDKSLDLDPTNNQVLLNRGLTLSALNRKNEAIESFAKSCGVGNIEGCKFLYESRGLILANSGRYAESLGYFDIIVQLSPSGAGAYKNRAIIYSKLGRLQEALNDYNKSLSLDPTNDKVQLNHALTLKALGREPEAVESFHKSCNAGNPEACKQLHHK